ncbi:MAG: hypothetical protein K2P87_07450 [Lachnospiraceae bacterium]|nr:hypothetical protein [Lachnospiraceae bacterium]
MEKTELEEVFCYGLDLGWESALISRYNAGKNEPEPVCCDRDGQELSMPVVLARRTADGEWLYGKEAARVVARGEALGAYGLLRRLLSGEELSLGGETYRAEFLMEEYLRRILALMGQQGGSAVTMLAVTLPEGALAAGGVLTDILARLGVGRERVLLLSHTECFMRYIVNMRQELWKNDTILFECGDEYFYYDRVYFSRKREPLSVMSKHGDLTEEYFGGGICREEAERRAYWFYNMVQQQLANQPVTSVFVTGSGFLDGWVMGALQKLCDGRRVFYGQNLFARGACYAAHMHIEGQDCLFLGENMTREDIMVKAYHDAKEQYFLLSEAGSDYRTVKRSLRLVLDDTSEVEFLVDHVMRREPLHEVMILDHLMQRENKTVRLELRLFYVDRDTPVVQLRDIGFGRAGTTHRIWEQIL